VELESIAPQDIAQVECGSGSACGEEAVAGGALDTSLAIALEHQASNALSSHDLKALSTLDEEMLVAAPAALVEAGDRDSMNEDNLEKQFQAILE